jgi:outer membrane protein TolC
MKRILMFLFLLPAVSVLSQERQLGLVECHELARANYPLVKRYNLIAQTEGYNVSNAGKGWLPQLVVNAMARYQSDVTSLPFDAGKLSALIPGFAIPTVSRDQYQLTAELTQTLWDGGMIGSAKALSHAQAEVERKQLESDLYALRERVNQVYFGCLLYDELLRQNELLQKELRVNIDRISAMMENGVANVSDRETVEVELLSVRQRETELQSGREAYLAVLCALTGRDTDRPTLAVPAMPLLPLKTEIKRPELAAFDAMEGLTGVQRRQVDAGLMPRIGLFVQGGYGRPGLNMLENSFEPFYIAGLRLSWNMGRFYTMANDRRMIETSRRTIDVQRDVFLFNTSLRLISGNVDIDRINKQLSSDGEILRLRSSIRKAAEAKLENGVISVSDLIREINAEDMARQNAATRRVQLLQAVYGLMYVTNDDF